MISDANKGITSIAYNHLNLPKTVNINDGGTNNGTISYIYDATGIKLSKTVSTGSTTYYAGNYVYEGSSLKFFNHPEGYIEPVDLGNYGSGFKYVYQYKDHLGNIRLSYTDSNNNGSVTSSEILEENNYYPFGLKHKGYNNVVSSNANSVAQKFKYNGMELEESLGLNLYEMDFRQYDPAIARFTSIDPVTHHSFSAYSAFDNNPVFFADPSGADAESFVMDLFNKSSSGTTWTNNGNGTFSDGNGNTEQCDDCPQEGQTRESKKVVGYGHGAVAVDATQYYHSGGVNGSKSGWYFEEDYLQQIQPIAETLAGVNFSYSGSMSWLSSTSAVEGYGDFLLGYSSVIAQRAETQRRYMASGAITPMGIDSPFFVVGGVGNLITRLGTRSKGLTIIGETMKRVEMAAVRNRGATILNDMPVFTGTRSQVTSQMMQYNRRWLLNQMRSGNTILDIGVDSARKSSSIFYQMEQSMLRNYQKLHPGALNIIKQ